ncbi:hypothetical protein CHU92_06300 [Flavobacterium cyanobacteriorum]|uniref:Membrane or secreted protein n=1 Tax=Flavobacterium cyanobacteriorum TaxID=2022802 RepID=A0A255Z9M9_9FLAO|nr:hypothetical protein [Flavobacterium cyanobacteriorum]OYQ38178.1 hypothetical protein CHU92_06300 [Flavobacterium cyanobacteriorum]
MKKLVLLSLLVLPLLLYIYFSLAKHNSLFLPVITKEVSELPVDTTSVTEPVRLKGKITVLGFIGKDVPRKKESLFNLNQKIYAKYKDFNDFQLVMIAPAGIEADVERVTAQLKSMADISGWKFVYLQPAQIKSFYSSLKADSGLDKAYGTFDVFIIDKERSLRGRKGKNKKGEEEYRDSYNTFSAAELHNEMTDDVKIVLREYRLALKKNIDGKNSKRQI